MSKKYLFVCVGLCTFIFSDFAKASCVNECKAALAAAELELEKLAGKDTQITVHQFTMTRNNQKWDCKKLCNQKLSS